MSDHIIRVSLALIVAILLLLTPFCTRFRCRGAGHMIFSGFLLTIYFGVQLVEAIHQ